MTIIIYTLKCSLIVRRKSIQAWKNSELAKQQQQNRQIDKLRHTDIHNRPISLEHLPLFHLNRYTVTLTFGGKVIWTYKILIIWFFIIACTEWKKVYNTWKIFFLPLTQYLISFFLKDELMQDSQMI